jgi:hypothetical protein
MFGSGPTCYLYVVLNLDVFQAFLFQNRLIYGLRKKLVFFVRLSRTHDPVSLSGCSLFEKLNNILAQCTESLSGPLMSISRSDWQVTTRLNRSPVNPADRRLIL